MPTTPAAPARSGGSASSRRPPSGQAWRDWGDRLFAAISGASALVVPALVVLLMVLLVRESLPSLKQLGWHFLVDSTWDRPGGHFGAWPFIYGTLITSFLAMLLAVPLGVAAAAYLSEIASGPVRRLASFLVELLAAIPSVIYGFWGLEFVVPALQKIYPRLGITNTSGKGYFTAAILLAIMIVPYITAITYDVCRAVPTSQRQAGLSLGATRWQLIRSVVLPYARSGIVGGGFLALGRALGETMAVAMLIGNYLGISSSIFGPGYSIPAVIATELGNYANLLHRSALIELGLVLFLVTVIVNVLARLLIRRVARPGGLGLAFWRRRPAVQAFETTEAAAIAHGPRPPSSAPARTTPLVSGLRNRAAGVIDRLMTVVLGTCLVLILVPLFHILSYVTVAGFSYIHVTFFTNLPGDEPPGLGNALVGSLEIAALATAWAVPIGVLAALFLTEYRRNRLAPAVRFVGEVLGGVPSVILGVFAYVWIVLPMKDFSAWAGAFALGVMMIPIIMRAAEEALKLVPSTLRTASYALGASHWQTVVRVIVPSALPAIITSIFLGVARVIGETAPLLFTAGNSQLWPQSPSARTPFLTYYIYTGALGEGGDEGVRLAWAGAVVLLIFVMALNVGVRSLTGRRVVAAARAD